MGGFDEFEPDGVIVYELGESRPTMRMTCTAWGVARGSRVTRFTLFRKVTYMTRGSKGGGPG